MNYARLVVSRNGVNALRVSLRSNALLLAPRPFICAGASFYSAAEVAKKDAYDKEEFLTMMTEASSSSNANCKILKESEGLVADKESVAANLLVMQFLASQAPVAGARFHDG